MRTIITIFLFIFFNYFNVLQAQTFSLSVPDKLSTKYIHGSSQEDTVVNMDYFDPDFMYNHYFYHGQHVNGKPKNRGALYVFDENGQQGPMFIMSYFYRGYCSSDIRKDNESTVMACQPMLLNTKAHLKDSEPEWYYPDEKTGAIPYTFYENIRVKPQNKRVLFRMLKDYKAPRNFLIYSREKLGGKELQLKPLAAAFGTCIEGDCINTPLKEKAKLKIDGLGTLWTKFIEGVPQDNAQLQLETNELVYVEFKRGLPIITYTRILPEGVSYVDLAKKDSRYFVENASCLEGNCVSGTGALLYAKKDIGLKGILYGEFEKNKIKKGTLHTLDGMVIDGDFSTNPLSGEFSVQVFNQTAKIQFEEGALIKNESLLGKGNLYHQLRTAYGVNKIKAAFPEKKHQVFAEKSILIKNDSEKFSYTTPQLSPGKTYTINILGGSSDIDFFINIKPKQSVFYTDIEKDYYYNRVKNGFLSYPLYVKEAQALTIELEGTRNFNKKPNSAPNLPVYILISEREI